MKVQGWLLVTALCAFELAPIAHPVADPAGVRYDDHTTHVTLIRSGFTSLAGRVCVLAADGNGMGGCLHAATADAERRPLGEVGTVVSGTFQSRPSLA
jgi:hypothetical protein